jgi:hypothetical protein
MNGMKVGGNGRMAGTKVRRWWGIGGGWVKDQMRWISRVMGGRGMDGRLESLDP